MSTLSQKALEKQIHRALADREMVALWGNANGKTSILYKMMGKLSIGVDGKLHSMLKSSHAENYKIEFLEGLELPLKSDRVDPDRVRRQILQSYGEKGYYVPSLEMRRKYIHLLIALDEARIIPVIAMDEVQLLPMRGYSMVKLLNEQQIGGKKLGPAFLLAGQFSKRRMPANFWMHCKEVQVGKIESNEVLEFIQTIAPGDAKYFTSRSHEKLAECESTLEMAMKVRRAIEYFRDNELKLITPDVLTRVSDRALYARNKMALAA